MATEVMIGLIRIRYLPANTALEYRKELSGTLSLSRPYSEGDYREGVYLSHPL
jgi:hypothetical protein